MDAGERVTVSRFYCLRRLAELWRADLELEEALGITISGSKNRLHSVRLEMVEGDDLAGVKRVSGTGGWWCVVVVEPPVQPGATFLPPY